MVFEIKSGIKNDGKSSTNSLFGIIDIINLAAPSWVHKSLNEGLVRGKM